MGAPRTNPRRASEHLAYFSLVFILCIVLSFPSGAVGTTSNNNFYQVSESFWLDPFLGSDSNDGSITQPFASFEPLQRFGLNDTRAQYYVYLSGGIYPVTSFEYFVSAQWNFVYCDTQCPKGANTGAAVIVPSPLTASGIFHDLPSSLLGMDRDVQRPALTFYNVTFEPVRSTNSSSPSPTYSSSIFFVPNGGILLASCTIDRFKGKDAPNKVIGRGIVDARASVHVMPFVGVLVQIINTTFVNNTYESLEIYDEAQKGLLISADNIYIDNSLFYANRVVAGQIQGGLIYYTSSLRVSNSQFIGNSGELSRYGYGLLFSGAKDSSATITSTQFIGQVFIGLSVGARKRVSIAYGSIIGFDAMSPGTVNISNSYFYSNEASFGGCFAIISIVATPDYRPGPIINTFTVSNSMFKMNSAHFGQGAVMHFDSRAILSDLANLTFISNLAPKQAQALVPGELWSFVTYTDPTLIHIQNGNGSVSMTDLMFWPNSTRIKSSLLPIQRISVSRVTKLQISHLTYKNVPPTEGKGSFLLLQTIRHIDIQNIDIRALFKIYSTYNAWQFISIEEPTQGANNKAYVHINGLRLSDCRATLSASLLSAHSIGILKLDHVHVDKGPTSASLPLISVQNSGRFEMRDSSLKDFASALKFTSLKSARMTNVSLSIYKSTSPAIAIVGCGALTVDDFQATTSNASIFAILNTPSVDIRYSTFSFVKLLQSTDVKAGNGTIMVSSKAHVTLTKCEFNDNTANFGAAFYGTKGVTLNISSSTFLKNQAYSDGGAVSLASGCKGLRITDSTFMQNGAGDRGGALSSFCPTTLNNVSFVYSSAHFGGAVYIEDSALPTYPACVHSKIADCKFKWNVAFGPGVSGGAVLFLALHSFHNETSSLYVTKTSFNEDSTLMGHGGGIATNGPLIVSASSFQNVRSASSGGSIYIQSSLAVRAMPKLTLDSNVFQGCTAKNAGGAVAYNISIPNQGGIFRSPYWNVVLSNNTFIRNLAARGGALASIGPTPNISTDANRFIGNGASFGGAIFVSSCVQLAHIRNQTFVNQNAMAGGVIFYLALVGSQTVPVDESLCNYSACSNITVTNWGPIMATSNLRLQAYVIEGNHLLNSTSGGYNATSSRLIESSISQSNEALPFSRYGSIFPDPWMFFPSVPKKVLIHATDQFSQSLRSHAFSQQMTVKWFCKNPRHDPCDNITFRRQFSQGQVEGADTVTMALVELVLETNLPAASLKDIEGVLLFDPPPTTAGDNSVPSSSLVQETILSSCGAGYGPDERNASKCVSCPLFSYSLNGTCQSCAQDSHVRKCSSQDIESNPNYWVSLNPTSNAYSSVRCPAGFCRGHNLCSYGRTGAMCGLCADGLHESITSTCIECNGPNWPLLVLAFLGSWIAALILHNLVSASSGKASILIFYMQTVLTITFQVPITEAFGLKSGDRAFPRFVQWFLCFAPFNFLERQLVIAAIPFVMMLQLSITFFVHRTGTILLGKLSNRGKQHHEDQDRAYEDKAQDPTSFGYDPAFDEDSVTVPPAFHSEQGPSSQEYVPIQQPRRSKRAVRFQDSDDPDMPLLDDVGERPSSSDEDAIMSQSEIELVTEDEAPNDSGSETSPKPSLHATAPDNDPFFGHGEPPVFLDEGHDIDQARATVHVHVHPGSFFHRRRYSRTLISLLASSFSSILSVVMATTGCVELMDGQRVLQGAPSVSCDGKQFFVFRWLYALFIPYLLVVFLALAIKLLLLYKQNRIVTGDARWGVIYEMYKRKFFAWRITEMIRRVCIVTVAQLFVNMPAIRALCLAALCTIFMTIHWQTRPYRQSLENWLESLSLFSLTAVALLIVWTSQAANNLPAIIAWALIVITAVLIAASFPFTLLTSYLSCTGCCSACRRSARRLLKQSHH